MDHVSYCRRAIMDARNCGVHVIYIHFCNPVGCYARMGLTPEDVNAFKRGSEAVITIVPALAPDQQVKLTLSLSGFTASYGKVSIIEQ